MSSTPSPSPPPSPRIRKRLKTTESTYIQQEVEPQSYYDNQRNIATIEERKKFSETKDLRIFNNWIKSVLIQNCVKEIKIKNEGKLAVLEIGCGKGGDLGKWKKTSAGLYVGVDISKTSLEEAQRRYLEFRDPNFLAYFFNQSGSLNPQLFYSNVDDSLYFDLVSMQFCMHYMFDSEESALNLFSNISRRLKNGGIFLCTIPDANVIVKRFREKGRWNKNLKNFVVDNKYYSMTIDELSFEKNRLFGLKYGFYLEEAVGSKKNISDNEPEITYVPEYLIEFQNLINLAGKFDLKLMKKESINFVDYFEQNKITYKFLFEKLGLKYNETNYSMEQDFWDIVHLYKIAVFKKERDYELLVVEKGFHELKMNHLFLDKKFN